MTNLPKQKPQTDRFVRLPHGVIDSAAYASLSGDAVKLLIAICHRYNGYNNGAIRFSLSEAEKALNRSRHPALKAFRQLRNAGLLIEIERGGFRDRAGVQGGMATAWQVSFLRNNSADVVKMQNGGASNAPSAQSKVLK